jgi:hypothetical protein
MVFVVILLLNILDILLTNIGLVLGAEEGNPVICYIMSIYGDNWWVVKMCIVSFFVALLYITRHNPYSIMGSKTPVVWYCLLTIYQFVMIFVVLT